MKVLPLKIGGAFEIRLDPHRDERGYFMRTFDRQIFADHDLQTEWVQESESVNNIAGILRGFHFQAPPHAETKLVRAIVGKVLDVFIDIRRYSPTFGQHEMVELSEEAENMVYIPKGCAHAFLTLSEKSILAYKMDAAYSRDAEDGIIWNDPTLNVPWPVVNEPLISERDSRFQTWENFDTPFK